MNSSIEKLEKIFEDLIKRKFKYFLNSEGENFEVSLDYDCSSRLDDLLQSIGLSVCGMHYRPSEITIDFELDNELTYDINNHILREITIHLDNDGNYDVSIGSRILDLDWRTSLINFSNSLVMKNQSPEFIDNVVNDIEKQLVYKSLKAH